MDLARSVLNERYAAQLDTLKARVRTAIGAIYQDSVSPEDLDAAFGRFAERAAPIVEAGQEAAVALNAAYLQTLVELEAGVDEQLADPALVKDIVGLTGEGASLQTGMEAFPAMVKDQIGTGRPIGEALGFGLYLAQRFGDAEVTSAVDRHADAVTKRSRRFRGWLGRLHGTCAACRERNAGEHPLSQTIYRHPHCRCTKEYLVEGGADLTPAERFGAKTTEQMHQADGKWSAERRRLHNEIQERLLGGHSRYATDQRQVYLTGGGPASGKSAFSGFGRVPSDAALINPDEIKAMLPEYAQAVAEQRQWAAAFVHDESSYLAKKISIEATNRQLNLSLDTVGDGSFENLSHKVEALRGSGSRVVADYATVSTDTAITRALARAETTGRFVPEEYIRESHAAISEVLPQAVDARLFDEVRLWNTEARPARLIMESIDGRTTILEPGLWDEFLAKAAPA
jgi:predicted ABC-type ATPase